MPAPAPAPAPKKSSGKKPALGAFKQAPPPAAPPEHEDLPPAATAEPKLATAPSAAPPSPSPAAASPTLAGSDGPEKTFDLDDAVVAWAAVLDSLPRSLQAAVHEAQPLSVEGNVITFGVSKTQIDNVKPRFQKDAHEIREKFIEQLGTPPRFKFTVHAWTGNGPGAKRRPARGNAVEEAPPAADDDPGPEEPHIDLVHEEDILDAPVGAPPTVDSISRLEDAFGATVVEELPRN